MNELATFLLHDIQCRMRFFSRIASGSGGNPEEYSTPVPVWPPWRVHQPSLWVCPPAALPAIPHSRSVRFWRRGRSPHGWPAALGPSQSHEANTTTAVFQIIVWRSYRASALPDENFAGRSDDAGALSDEAFSREVSLSLLLRGFAEGAG